MPVKHFLHGLKIREVLQVFEITVRRRVWPRASCEWVELLQITSMSKRLSGNTCVCGLRKQVCALCWGQNTSSSHTYGSNRRILRIRSYHFLDHLCMEIITTLSLTCSKTLMGRGALDKKPGATLVKPHSLTKSKHVRSDQVC